MKNIWLITKYTLREAFAKNIFMIFLGISTLVILGFALFFSFSDITDIVSKAKNAGISKDIIIMQFIKSLHVMSVVPLFAGGLFLSIFSTAGIFAQMLEKGNIDLFLSKPVSRIQLVLGKYFGGIAVVFINVAYAVGGIWLLIALKFGYWDPTFLYTILTITFAFAVLYSLIVLTCILTGSSVLAMVVSYLIFFILSPILAAKGQFLPHIESGFWKAIITGFYYIVPQTSELSGITASIAGGMAVRSFQPVLTCSILLLFFLTLSIVVFRKKDY